MRDTDASRAEHDARTPQWANAIHTGDCFEEIAELPSESVHAIVTDPPYGLNFMGKDWDNFRRKNNDDDAGRENVFGRTSSTSPAHGAETEGKRYQVWCEEWARLAIDVLKPGGHMLAFSGNRTHHRLFSGVEDAGFEIRDTITWHYGSGFPKALDVSKAIDKRERSRFVEQLTPEILDRAGVPNPQATYHDWTEGGHSPGDDHWQTLKDGIDGSEELQREVVARIEESAESDKFSSVYTDDYHGRGYAVTEAATDAAARWDGWKSALKPATEFVVVARKPLSEGTVAENVQAHGTGALNVDGTRIEAADGGWTREGPIHDIRGGNYASADSHGKRIGDEDDVRTGHEEGRYPANVVFDERAAAGLDTEVGELDAGAHTPASDQRDVYSNGDAPSSPDERTSTDSGGPSRYFYTSKATRAERTLDGQIDNTHPTVKPLDLMEWLVTLVTAQDQIVLDPFAGTGTTCRAAKDAGRSFVGIEKSPKWADVSRARCGLTVDEPARVRGDDQAGIEQFATDGGTQ